MKVPPTASARVPFPGLDRAANAVPPLAWFGVSALSRYLGPAFAVLLFPVVGVLGIAWFRIATAALFFAPITRPWRTLREADGRTRLLLLGLGACLAAMNMAFYLALERLPMSLVAAMEFLGTLIIALHGLRTVRNLLALALAAFGVVLLIDVTWASDPLGLFWAALNAALFAGYIVLGHRAAEAGAGGGVERLGAAMAIAFVLLMPVGVVEAARAFGMPLIVLAGIGVGLTSSVIPYVCDQLAMARLPRASFALLLALLPATAAVIGAVVLVQIPGLGDVLAIALVMAGIALHRPAAT
ncbi:EamA family transporter [Afifella pfennigii]|uniref:EamA family transporter n=1 Tax=Afifella pfennigii TaxID=209897 RepID=UPI000A02B31B|nr:EamA family transporter [Afifella pfennigii]